MDDYGSMELKDAVDVAVLEAASSIEKITGFEPVVCEVTGTKDAYRVMLNNTKEKRLTPVGNFSLTALPGCCGVVVFYHAHIDPALRKKGIGGLLLSARIRAAELAGYSLAQATVISSNEVEIAMLESEGFKEVNQFVNSRTRNTVLVYQKTLKLNEKE